MSKAAVKISGDLLSNPLCEQDLAFLESMNALDTAMKRMDAFNQEKVRFSCKWQCFHTKKETSSLLMNLTFNWKGLILNYKSVEFCRMDSNMVKCVCVALVLVVESMIALPKSFNNVHTCLKTNQHYASKSLEHREWEPNMLYTFLPHPTFQIKWWCTEKGRICFFIKSRRNINRFGTTWGWVNHDKLHFWVKYSFKSVTCLRVQWW